MNAELVVLSSDAAAVCENTHAARRLNSNTPAAWCFFTSGEAELMFNGVLEGTLVERRAVISLALNNSNLRVERPKVYDSGSALLPFLEAMLWGRN